MARVQELAFPRGSGALLVVALLAGLAAAILVFVALARSDGGSDIAPSGSSTQVVVAKQAIAAGTTVTPEMVEVVAVPEGLLVEEALTDSALAVDEVTRVAVAKGEQITPAKIGTPVEGEGITYVIPLGMRAAGIEVTEVTAAGGHALPGNFVDVLAAFEDQETGRIRVVTVLDNVEVLAVGDTAQQPLGAAARDGERDVATSGQLPEDAKEQPNAGTVTVAVDPSQAQLLVAVQEQASRVWISLRGAGDDAPVELPATELPATGP